MHHLGDSGQKKMNRIRGIAGIKADPSCNRQAFFPVCTIVKFAHVPKKIPNAVQSCHDMTKAPRMAAGAFSAA